MSDVLRWASYQALGQRHESGGQFGSFISDDSLMEISNDAKDAQQEQTARPSEDIKQHLLFYLGSSFASLEMCNICLSLLLAEYGS